jgi:GT2 family glycosyltransferase
LADDFAFCHRARQCGYRIMADTSIRLWHLGSRAFSWEEAGCPTRRYSTYHFRLSDPSR